MSINLIRKHEKFLVASRDNTITLWRMKNKSSSSAAGSYPDQVQCEQIIQEDFGGIYSLILPIRE